MPDAAIAHSPLFTNLSPDECRIVSEMMTASCYESGEAIITEGKETSSLYLLSHGTCRVRKHMGNGADQDLDTLEVGAVFGEISFFCPGPHSATVVAETRATILSLSREQFHELQRERPTAALKITLHATATLARRLRRMDEWTCALVEKGTAPEKHTEWHEFRAQLYSNWNF